MTMLVTVQSARAEEINGHLNIHTMEKLIKAQGETIERMELKLTNLEESIGHVNRGRRQAESVGFTAVLDHEEAVHTGNMVKFNKILYNAGNMYNPITGIATIPTNGVYLFSFSIEEWETPELSCRLKVDGVQKVGAVIVPNHHSDQAGNTAVLHLTKGQSVWVESTEGTVYGESGFYGTSFTGVLLY
ncbi:inner ear-specific collagen-like [Mya arenaria]|uniref:inner ear-specific collagen-like n=1 Tax=Mya arenaria TaxID=6604 RepID=UPI0022E11096|nr:inner ear-specific collagen-like [Mya arenaria]